MELVNYTPFPASTWPALDPAGGEFGVLLVRGCLKMLIDPVVSKTSLSLADNQGALFGEDIFYGEAGQSSLRFESDFVPFKTCTDLIVNATAYSPGGIVRPRWDCAVRVQDDDGAPLLKRILRVTGERTWRRKTGRWALSEPIPCDQVPIRYELAYGGALRAPPDEHGNPGPWLAFCARNPLGRGLLHRGRKESEVPAPRIEDPVDPISDARKTYVPVGLGYIHRSWAPRLALAGTYDDAWLKHKHPLPPDDFDPSHNNGAHPDLIGAGRLSGYLRGDEILRLQRLLPKLADCTLKLPAYRLLARLRYKNGIDLHLLLNLDTVVLDLDPPSPSEPSLYLSWRKRYRITPEPMRIEVMLLKPHRSGEAVSG